MSKNEKIMLAIAAYYFLVHKPKADAAQAAADATGQAAADATKGGAGILAPLLNAIP